MGDATHPLFRVTTFGRFSLSRLSSHSRPEEEIVAYEPVEEHVWRSRTVAGSLLKLLLCRTRRRAPKDFLIEALWPDTPLTNANHSLDTAMSLLRNLLRSTGKESLLTTIHSGAITIYELPPQHLLWADIDEFLSYVTQAERIEVQGGDPLPFFESAWQIGHEVFFEDELYCEWAQARRQTINSTRHRVLHRLADGYMRRNKPQLAEELLLKALEEEPTDEDSTYRLMVLLEQQGRRQEALHCYERLATALRDEAEAEPLPATQALVQQLRTPVLTTTQFPSASPPISFPYKIDIDLQVYAMPQGQPGAALLTTNIPITVRNGGYGVPLVSSEREIHTTPPESHLSSYNERHTYLSSDLFYRIIKEILLWTGQEGFQHHLQIVIGRLLKEFDTMEKHLPADSLFSRRDILIMIAGLPLALIPTLQTGTAAPAILEEFLAQCTASIAVCWQLLRGTELHQVEPLLSRSIPELEKLACQPSKYQKNSASLAAQGHLLFATLALHHNNLLAREAHCKKVIQFGRLAEDVNLHVTGLKWLAVTYYYARQPAKALHAYQEMTPFLDHISPLLRGSVYIKMAVTYAQCGHDQDALQYIRMAQEHFPEHPEQDPCFPYADCGQSTLPIWEGLVYLDLGQPKEASNAFERIERFSDPVVISERARIEAINHQAEAAIALGDQERFRMYIEMGVKRATVLGSEKRYNEARGIYRQAKLIWSNEARIKELQELFIR